MKGVIQISLDLDLDLNTLRECRRGFRLDLDLDLEVRFSLPLTKVVSVNIPTWPRL